MWGRLRGSATGLGASGLRSGVLRQVEGVWGSFRGSVTSLGGLG